jgi:hypothetical protein
MKVVATASTPFTLDCVCSLLIRNNETNKAFHERSWRELWECLITNSTSIVMRALDICFC